MSVPCGCPTIVNRELFDEARSAGAPFAVWRPLRHGSRVGDCAVARISGSTGVELIASFEKIAPFYDAANEAAGAVLNDDYWQLVTAVYFFIGNMGQPRGLPANSGACPMLPEGEGAVVLELNGLESEGYRRQSSRKGGLQWRQEERRDTRSS